jgi:hypothetical protein
MSPKILKKSQLSSHKSSPKFPKKTKIQLPETSQNPKPLKIMLFSKYGFYEPPKQASILNKKRKTPDDIDDDECEDRDELLEGEDAESPIRRTRSQNPDLYDPLPPPTRSRRPKVYPALTPWLDDWNVAELNDFYPKGGFKWDNSDVPDFDLGEPLHETNFWEGPWIAADEEKKRNRDEREKKRKKQSRYGGLKPAGRKRAFKKGLGKTIGRQNGKFVKLESD